MSSGRLFRVSAASLLLAVAACGVLWASGARESAGVVADTVHLRVATLRGPTGMGMVPLLEEGPSVAPGVSVSYEVVGTPEVMVSRILSGDVDFASLPLNLAAKLYNSGVRYQLAAVNVLGVLYLVSDESSVHTLQDLKGKRVYLTGKGANPDFLLRYVLTRAGLTPDKDVQLDFQYDQVELSSLMVAGRLHLALLPEPFVTQVVEKNPNDKVVMRFADAWREALGKDISLAQGCLVVNAKSAQEHPQAVKAFLAAYKRSVAWVNANHEQAGVLIQKHGMGLNAAAAASAISRMSLVYQPATDARVAVEQFLSVLLRFAPQSIGGKLPDSGFYLSN